MSTTFLTSRRGFTLIEILAALLVSGVFISIFASVFINNWRVFEERMAQANLWFEANQIVDILSREVRHSRQIDISNSGKTATIYNAIDSSVSTYSIKSEGTFEYVLGGVTRTVSDNLDFALSSFSLNGRNLIVRLTLRDDALDKKVSVTSESEILPRN